MGGCTVFVYLCKCFLCKSYNHTSSNCPKTLDIIMCLSNTINLDHNIRDLNFPRIRGNPWILPFPRFRGRSPPWVRGQSWILPFPRFRGRSPQWVRGPAFFSALDKSRTRAVTPYLRNTRNHRLRRYSLFCARN